MKKIFTLLLSLGTLSTLFAQQDYQHNRQQSGSQTYGQQGSYGTSSGRSNQSTGTYSNSGSRTNSGSQQGYGTRANSTGYGSATQQGTDYRSTGNPAEQIE